MKYTYLVHNTQITRFTQTNESKDYIYYEYEGKTRRELKSKPEERRKFFGSLVAAIRYRIDLLLRSQYVIEKFIHSHECNLRSNIYLTTSEKLSIEKQVDALKSEYNENEKALEAKESEFYREYEYI